MVIEFLGEFAEYAGVAVISNVSIYHGDDLVGVGGLATDLDRNRRLEEHLHCRTSISTSFACCRRADSVLSVQAGVGAGRQDAGSRTRRV